MRVAPRKATPGTDAAVSSEFPPWRELVVAGRFPATFREEILSSDCSCSEIVVVRGFPSLFGKGTECYITLENNEAMKIQSDS
jgi:hypothetical protein